MLSVMVNTIFLGLPCTLPPSDSENVVLYLGLIAACLPRSHALKYPHVVLNSLPLAHTFYSLNFMGGHASDVARLDALADLGLGLAIEITTVAGVTSDEEAGEAVGGAVAAEGGIRDGLGAADHVCQHVASFASQLKAAARHDPELVLVCGGRDHWSVADKIRFHADAAAVWAAASADTGNGEWWSRGSVCFRTAARTTLSHPAVALAVLEAVPSVKICLELGQWCVAAAASATELTTCPHWGRLLSTVQGRAVAVTSAVGSADWPRLPHPTDDQVRCHAWNLVLETNVFLFLLLSGHYRSVAHKILHG